MQGYKNQLEYIRNEVRGAIDTRKIEEVSFFISEQYRSLLERMTHDLLNQMEKPKNAFSLICGGSTGQNIASPYSDVELAFLIDEGSDSEDREYFKIFSHLLTLRLIAIGETPVTSAQLPSMSWMKVHDSPSPRGFMLNPPQLSPLKYMIGTPSEMAKILLEQSQSDKSNFYLSFINFSHVTGSKDLVNEYTQSLSHLFDRPEKEKISSEIILRGLTQWSSKCLYDDFGEHFSIKFDLIRSLHIPISTLRFKFWLRQANTPWSIVRELRKNGVLEEEMEKKILTNLDEIGGVPIKAYLQFNQQSEWLTISPIPTPVASYQMDESKLLEIYRLTASFHEHIRSLDPVFKDFQTGLPPEKIINLTFLQFDRVEEYFKSELKKNQHNSSFLKNYGIFLMSQGQHEQAWKYFENSLQLSDSSIEQAQLNHYLGLIQLNLDG